MHPKRELQIPGFPFGRVYLSWTVIEHFSPNILVDGLSLAFFFSHLVAVVVKDCIPLSLSAP